MYNPLRKIVEFYSGKYYSKEKQQNLQVNSNQPNREERKERLRKIIEESHEDFLFDLKYNAGRRGLIKFYP